MGAWAGSADVENRLDRLGAAARLGASGVGVDALSSSAMPARLDVCDAERRIASPPVGAAGDETSSSTSKSVASDTERD